jgi:tetratricopeptide (TPR) repeat protein
VKFLVSLFVIAVTTSALYIFLLQMKNRKISPKKRKKKAIAVSAIVALFLLGFLALVMYSAATAPDTQCLNIHATTTISPVSLETAMDYFQQGNYDYDTGNCAKAIADYSVSINKDPEYPQAYNNRAYTLMRMHNYRAALEDLDVALSLNPNYIQALVNRGDIHNYYNDIDRPSAVADYEKVISLGATIGTSVCGHLFLAKHNGWNVGTLLDVPGMIFNACN